MAGLTETSTWENEIYQLETTDPVEGGSGGISNTQGKQLGNRTRYLYDQLIPKNKGYVIIPDIVPSSGISLSQSGFASAVTFSSGTMEDETFVLVTMNDAMPDMDYRVENTVEALGSLNTSNDYLGLCFKKVSTTQFQIAIKESAPGTNNIKVHLKVIKNNY